MGSVVRVRRSPLLSGHQDVGTAELSRGNPAVSNSFDSSFDEAPDRSAGRAFGLELYWPARGRGSRRWRKNRAARRPMFETDYGISLFR